MIENQKQQAESLFLNTERSQKEIASQLGIDPKTLYRWIKEGHWQQLKSATRRMPSVLVENIYEQLNDINYRISQRDRGERHPTKDESLTISRLTNCINKVQKQTSQGQNIQFMMNFIDYVRPLNDDLAKLLTNYGSAFLNGSQIKGFHPYDIEYGEQTPGSYNTALSFGEGRAEASPRPDYNPNQPELPFPNDTSLSFGEGRGEASLALDYNPNQLELPFPNMSDNTSLSFGEGRAEASIGHESGIEKNEQIIAQQHGNQSEESQTPTTKMPEMPENNLPYNRAPLASLRGTKQSHDCTDSLVDDNKPDSDTQPLSLGETPEPPYYYRKCIQDANDPYTFYYDKITRRTIDSPKYGKPPDGFREVPKKDCLDKDYYGKGFGRYNWL